MTMIFTEDALLAVPDKAQKAIDRLSKSFGLDEAVDPERETMLLRDIRRVIWRRVVSRPLFDSLGWAPGPVIGGGN